MSRNRRKKKLITKGVVQNIGLCYSIVMETNGRFWTPYALYQDGYQWDADGMRRDRPAPRNPNYKLPDAPLRNAVAMKNPQAARQHFRGLTQDGSRDFVMVYDHKLVFWTISWRALGAGIKEEKWMSHGVRTEEAPAGFKYVYGYNNRHRSNYAVTDDELMTFDNGVKSPYGDIHCIPLRRPKVKA